jgi:hypothetical protein
MFVLSSAVGNTAPPILVDPQTGKYLGNLSNNPYDQDSTSNPYGQYGSEYSQDSINNPYGQYGSEYSNDSPNNPCATNPPAIMDSDGYYDYLKFRIN